MACYLVIVGAGPRKGDIVTTQVAGHPIGAAEQPPAFVRVRVPDMDWIAARQHAQAWVSSLGFAVVASDLSQDLHRIRLYNLTASASAGNLTRRQVERFIQSWGGAVVSEAANEVRFDISIYDAARSPAFLGYPQAALDQVDWSEVSYDQQSGEHVIEADYAVRVNPNSLDTQIRSVGAEIVDHDAGVVRYRVTRAGLQSRFITDINDRGRVYVSTRSRYYLPESVVNHILNQGGMIEADRDAVESYVRDRRTDG